MKKIFNRPKFAVTEAGLTFRASPASAGIRAAVREKKLLEIKEMRAGAWEYVSPIDPDHVRQVFDACRDDEFLTTFAITCAGEYIFSLDQEFAEGPPFFRLPRVRIDFDKAIASDAEVAAVRSWLTILIEKMPSEKKPKLPAVVLADFAFAVGGVSIMRLERKYEEAVRRVEASS